jgi:hypothetical protein
MATRRKATTNRRRRSTAANPRRRRTNAVVVVRRNRRRAVMSNRRRNPIRRRRRRNPNVKTLIQGGLYAALGAMAQTVISGFIPIRAEGIMGIGVQLGTAYLTAMIGERLLPGNSQFFAAGAAAAVGKSVIDYALGLVGGATTGQLSSAAPQQVAPPNPGMSDIAIWDEPGMSDISTYDWPAA